VNDDQPHFSSPSVAHPAPHHAGTCDVVTIGESMVLFQPLLEGPLPYAPLFHRTVAGAESNVAIALTRLGKKVRWINRLGSDPFGDIIASTLAGEGGDVSFVERDGTAPTAIFFREFKSYSEPHAYFYRRHSAASRLSPQDVRPAWFEGAGHLHVTGITPALGPSTLDAITTAMRLAREKGLSVSFDPNLRRKPWDEDSARQALLSLVPWCDVFLPGIEEAAFLIGAHPVEEYGPAFLGMGPRVVALKMGAQGSIGFVEGHALPVAPHPVARVVDPIGAGDAFAAGFLSVALHDLASGEHTLSPTTLRIALERANVLGALATQFRGDWEGLPSLAELERIQAGQNPITR
jgi:2-dehydro-3-deoxygluconokinase